MGIEGTGVGGFAALAVAYSVCVFIVHVILGLAVNGDAKRLVAMRSGVFLVGPLLWGWITFIFGLPALALYWAVHHSQLRAMEPPHGRHPQDRTGAPQSE